VNGLPDAPWLAAHRGDQDRGPENSLAACRAAPATADLVEIDCRLTGDGVLVVFHDATLERLAGREGQVERLALEELRTVEIGEGHSIPTLEELLASLPPGFPVNLELKRDEADPDALVTAVVAAIDGRRAILVSSFETELLVAVRDRCPDVPLAPISSDDPTGLLVAGERLGAWSIHLHARLATTTLVESAHAAGRRVLVFTVNEPEEARRLIGCGVDGIFSDWPGRMQATRPV